MTENTATIYLSGDDYGDTIKLSVRRNTETTDNQPAVFLITSCPACTYKLEIGGNDCSASILWRTLQINNTLNGRDTLRCTLFAEESSGYRPDVGETFIFGYSEDDAPSIFCGSIDEITEYEEPGTDLLKFNLLVVDWSQILDRKKIAEDYAASTIYDVITHFASNYLDDDGITVNNVNSTGGTTTALERYVLNYQTAAAAMDELCDIGGLSWYVDVDKDLHVFDRETNTAATTITEYTANAIAGSVKVKTNREKYRNRQFVRAGFDLSATRSEYWLGDGETKAFLLEMPAGMAPTLISVNDASSVIGIYNVDVAADWFYELGSQVVRQSSGAVTLTAADTLHVSYQGKYPILIELQDSGEIAARKAVEGGSGVYEGLEDNQNLNSQALGISTAQGLIDRFGTIPQIVTFDTDNHGLRAGQILTITLPTHDLAASYLISEVRAWDMDGQHIRYSVKALSGENLGGWQSFFKSLVRKRQTYVIRENEVIIKNVQFEDVLTLSEDLDYTTVNILDAIGTAQVGTSVIYL